MILAGRDLKPRLGTMALWLRKHALDFTVVAIGVLKDGDRLYLKPQVVIPVPSEDKLRTAVSIGSSDKPWLSMVSSGTSSNAAQPRAARSSRHL